MGNEDYYKLIIQKIDEMKEEISNGLRDPIEIYCQLATIGDILQSIEEEK